MRGTKRIRMWLQALTSKRRVERELDEEMRFHIDMEADKHARRGVPPVEARRRASDNNRRAKYYRLTAKGRRALGVETESWRRYVIAVEDVLATN